MRRPLQLDRRSLLKLGGTSALALALPPWSRLAIAARREPCSAELLVLADRHYEESLAFAASLERQGAETLQRGRDLAELWSRAIAPRLRSGTRAIAGLTLQSDLFGLERLAESSGATTLYVGCHDWRGRNDATHSLRGVLDLEHVAAALWRGRRQWAAALATALVSANGERREKHSLSFALDHGARDGSPRYFVSWLMVWSDGPRSDVS